MRSTSSGGNAPSSAFTLLCFGFSAIRAAAHRRASGRPHTRTWSAAQAAGRARGAGDPSGVGAASSTGRTAVFRDARIAADTPTTRSTPSRHERRQRGCGSDVRISAVPDHRVTLDQFPDSFIEGPSGTEPRGRRDSARAGRRMGRRRAALLQRGVDETAHGAEPAPRLRRRSSPRLRA